MKNGVKQIVTEDQARINELCRDLEEHTGVSNVKDKERSLTQKRIRKQPHKILKEEKQFLVAKMNEQL